MAPAPQLSLVIALVSDTTRARADVHHLLGCLAAIAQQVAPPPMEIIVPVHDRVDGLETVRARFPHVVLVQASDATPARPGSREHHDVLRARGLAAARGQIVALIEDCGRPRPDFCANVMSAHGGNAAAIGGAIDNGVDRRLNWAVYFCDFGRYQPPLEAGASDWASDANVSYKRAILESVRSVWEQSFREPAVNGELGARGHRLELGPAVIVDQHRDDLRFGPALRERFVWGRSYAQIRNRTLSGPKRLLYGGLSPILPLILFARMARTAWIRRRRFGKFTGAAPLILLLLASWSLGEGLGYFVKRPTP